ncbi:unnamed protein product [Phytophthora fragariaefolia]|uniref:Unnamed protein product n=1 Tax=Phytophthora fragariaefolia TaxID=1490495 RepID=A0A9W6U8U2_9STRA|nr:unnamed protein product [Phytophthora fragariaefolia]
MSKPESIQSSLRKRRYRRQLKSVREERFAARSWTALQDSNNPVYSLVREFENIFPEKIPAELPAERGVRHDIDPGSKYCVTRQWLLPRDQVQANDDFFEGRRKAGHVRESTSPHSGPTYCVKKATGGWRIVHAFNKLNEVTIAAQIPIPRKDMVVDTMSGSVMVDLTDGFYQIIMRESDIPVMAVSTPNGMLWEWLVMPQGLKNAPATFNRTISHMLRPLCAFAPGYFDDIFVHSRAEDGLTAVDPMSSSLKKDVAWDWRPEHQYAFEAVKQSRAVCVESGLNATMSSPVLPLRQQIADAYNDDPFYAGIIRYLRNPTAGALAKLTRPTRDTITSYDLDGDLLTYAIYTFDTPRVVIPADDDLRARLVHEYHDAPAGGHLGCEKTFAAISLYRETATEDHVVEGHALHAVAHDELAAVDAAMLAASTVANFASKPTSTPIDSAATSEHMLHRQAVRRLCVTHSPNADRRGQKNMLSRRGDRVRPSTDGIQGSSVTNLGLNKLAPRFIGSVNGKRFFVQVDYAESPSRSTSGTAAPPTRDASPRVLRTPNTFPERPAGLLAMRELSEPRDPPPGTVDSAMEESVVTNDLDEVQSRQVALELQAPVSRRPVARPLLAPSIRDYGFQPRDPAETARHAASQLLNM